MLSEHLRRRSPHLYDVIVMGAGPAGNIAAHRLSREGHKVAVLDWREYLGDKLCTGIVGRECVERYPPDRAHIFGKASSASVIAPSGKSHRVAKDEPQAYIIDRVAFVASLAGRASEAGAHYRLGEKVTEVRSSKTGVDIRTTSHAGSGEYKARVAIVASGFSSSLVRMAGLADGGRDGHMVGCQAQVTAYDLEETEIYLGKAIAPGSFGWLVPVSGSTALLGLVSRQKLNGHMGDFLSTLQKKGKVGAVIKPAKRWGIPLKALPRTFGDGVVVVGDAAGFAKPTTGGGIYYALLSGEIAAEVVHEAFVGGEFSARGLGAYEARWKSVFGRELRIGYYARRLYEALDDDQIERLLDGFLSAQIEQEFLFSGDFSFDWHSGSILKAIGHRELGKVIRSFGPTVASLLLRLNGSRSG